MSKIILITLLFLHGFVLKNFSQVETQATDIFITNADRNIIITSVIEHLNKFYVFSEKATFISKTIQDRYKKGRYSKISKGLELSDTLTKHLRELSKDEHLGTIFSLEKIPDEEEKPPTPEERQRFKRFASAQNYGFEKLERLPGNIGYMELNGFIRAEWGAETAIAAMNFLSNTDALIIDFRYNGGGEPGLIQLICTYFFEKPVHLNSIYWREGNRTEQFWTLTYVQGTRYISKPVYILTSKNTFSAAEDFAYSLQALKRVTIIGEKTKGGANAGRSFRINDHFGIYIPIGTAINPVTGKNWEGGIIPDVEVSANDALKQAHILALKELIMKTNNENKKQQLESILKELK